MPNNDLSWRELIPSAVAGIIISIAIDIVLLISEISEIGIFVNFGIIVVSAILTGVIIVKYNAKTHQASITGTHTLSFIGMTIIQYTFAETIKKFLGT